MVRFNSPEALVYAHLFIPASISRERLSRNGPVLNELANYAYTLGTAGNRTNVLELNGRKAAYGYDNDYRLTSEAITSDPGGNNGTVSYVYDVVGNCFSMSSTLNAVPGGSFFYDANDRLTTDTYDNNGNTVSSTGISNRYDFENRMLTRWCDARLRWRWQPCLGNRWRSDDQLLVDSLNPTHLPEVLDETVNGSVT